MKNETRETKNKKRKWIIIAAITGTLFLSAGATWAIVTHQNNQLMLTELQTKADAASDRADQSAQDLTNAQAKIGDLTEQNEQKAAENAKAQQVTRGTWIGDINAVPAHLRDQVTLDTAALAREIHEVIAQAEKDGYLIGSDNNTFYGRTSQGQVQGAIGSSVTVYHALAPTVQSTFSMNGRDLGARTSTRID
ncbi:MAG: hypothetical protein LBI11_05880 [Streptococcaceae bacterium]|jgi:hypothetical protein|nr:hypothetical protein [Streptococcaceae bacterium]